MQAQMETAADKYRRLKKEKEVLHDVDCECGMVWKCRKAGMQFWIASGIIPSSLAAIMAEQLKKGHMNEADLMASLNTDQLVQSIEASSNIVRHTAVEPRIVEHATEPNDIAQDEVMMCCYNRLRDWQMKGGDEAKGLSNFRDKQ